MSNAHLDTSVDTIAAIATPPGKGGVGIVRLSGPLALSIGQTIANQNLKPRHAHFSNFYEQTIDTPKVLDQGIILYFPAPNSYTGEAVVELQGHGGPVVMDMLMREALRLGAVMARPGQFTERAFLNDKIDLSQAEAIADLIDSNSQEAAHSALQSMQGEFSRRVNLLIETLIALRAYIEASIDFPEEEVDFLSESAIGKDLDEVIQALDSVLREARQGSILREGMTVVIAGKPNAGKSSLLNALTDTDAAIVSSIEGTTRDVLKEHIHIDGMPLHIIDTAGLRDNPDEVEKIGIERAWREIRNADRILLVSDSSINSQCNAEKLWPDFIAKLGTLSHVTLIRNKCDVSSLPAGLTEAAENPVVTLSAKTRQGLDVLHQHLKSVMGYSGGEGHFTARRRHLDALERARAMLVQGKSQLESDKAAELLADDLYHAQQALGEITGEFRADDLLGYIFSSFCIGK
jgi:tRNA modification GTPase